MQLIGLVGLQMTDSTWLLGGLIWVGMLAFGIGWAIDGLGGGHRRPVPPLPASA